MKKYLFTILLILLLAFQVHAGGLVGSGISAAAGNPPHRYWRLYIDAIGGGSYVDLAEIELRASQGGADQTGSGTASASSTYIGTDPSNLVDDNTSTIWTSNGGPPQWWAYDFGVGVEKDIVEVAILPRQDGALYTRFPTALRLQYSDNGTDYTDAVSWVTRWWNVSRQIFQVSPPATNGYYRYWSLSITAPDLCGGSEMEFRSSQGGANETGSGVAGADSSLDGSLLPPNAFDNSTSTAWLSNGTAGPHWIAYDFGLGVTKKIVEVTIIPRMSPDQPQFCANNFYLQGWNSGQAPVNIYYWITTWPNVNQQIFNSTNAQ